MTFEYENSTRVLNLYMRQCCPKFIQIWTPRLETITIFHLQYVPSKIHYLNTNNSFFEVSW